MAVMTSYDLKGKKDSFANWISNLSPTDTFFVSVTKKEAVKNTLFQWQTDTLATADTGNAQVEGTTVTVGACAPTKVHENVTQILRKAIEVTDTADALDNWGRSKELAYQMEKAGKEIKRDLEAILLSAQTKTDGSAAAARKTACFEALVATPADTDTGAVVVKETAGSGVMKESELFDVSYNLFLSGSDANIIMYHPKHASFFSSLMEVGGDHGRFKLIENMDTKLNRFISSVVDPLGQEFKLVPNRYMPENRVYFFNPTDWTQMVLREPSKTQLAKKSSSERYMIEMELGLRHRHPYASGILKIKA